MRVRRRRRSQGRFSSAPFQPVGGARAAPVSSSATSDADRSRSVASSAAVVAAARSADATRSSAKTARASAASALSFS